MIVHLNDKNGFFSLSLTNCGSANGVNVRFDAVDTDGVSWFLHHKGECVATIACDKRLWLEAKNTFEFLAVPKVRGVA